MERSLEGVDFKFLKVSSRFTPFGNYWRTITGESVDTKGEVLVWGGHIWRRNARRDTSIRRLNLEWSLYFSMKVFCISCILYALWIVIWSMMIHIWSHMCFQPEPGYPRADITHEYINFPPRVSGWFWYNDTSILLCPLGRMFMPHHSYSLKSPHI